MIKAGYPKQNFYILSKPSLFSTKYKILKKYFLFNKNKTRLKMVAMADFLYFVIFILGLVYLFSYS